MARRCKRARRARAASSLGPALPRRPALPPRGGDSESDLPLLQAGRRRLVVGNPDLARLFPATSLLIEPRTTTGDDLRRSLDRLFQSLAS
jgi:hypothetical protein